MYDIVLFDMDGTLMDSAEGITNSVTYALNKMGIQVEDKKELLPFIGPPLVDSFKKYYGFTEDEADQAVVYYREYFGAGGLLENQVYEGIHKLLEHLKNQGKALIVATSKPENYTNIILDHFDLSKYFDVICGASLDASRRTKIAVIKYALESAGITDTSNAVMIGDRNFDIFGGQEVNMDTIGVLYGYGSLEELTEAGATHIAETVEDLYKLI